MAGEDLLRNRFVRLEWHNNPLGISWTKVNVEARKQAVFAMESGPAAIAFDKELGFIYPVHCVHEEGLEVVRAVYAAIWRQFREDVIQASQIGDGLMRDEASRNRVFVFRKLVPGRGKCLV